MKKDFDAVDAATEYLMETYGVDKDEAMSMLGSNEILLSIPFGLIFLGHYINKRWKE